MSVPVSGQGTAALFSLFCCQRVGDRGVQIRTWLRDSLLQIRVMNQIPTGKTLRRHIFHGIKGVQVYL